MSKRTHKPQVKRLEQHLVFNPKQEQVLRAIYLGFYDGCVKDVLAASPTRGTALANLDPDTYHVIGIADARGYRFKPESNSALITLGYNPSAVLLWLTMMRLDGQPVVKVQDGDLVALHAAVAQCARDVVFNYEKLAMVKGKPRVVAKPILDAYRAYVLEHGKPAKFA